MEFTHGSLQWTGTNTVLSLICWIWKAHLSGWRKSLTAEYWIYSLSWSCVMLMWYRVFCFVLLTHLCCTPYSCYKSIGALLTGEFWEFEVTDLKVGKVVKHRPRIFVMFLTVAFNWAYCGWKKLSYLLLFFLFIKDIFFLCMTLKAFFC